MSKKRNLLFLSLLILGILLLTSCFLQPPATEGILKGQVIVPEELIKTKDLTGQALPDATVNIIDLSTGLIIATTTTDADGNYQVFVLPGGPYLLEAVKDEVKLQQITPPVEVNIEYDLGTADCSTTSVALIAQAMLEAEDYPDDLADINLVDIETNPDFADVMNPVCSIIEAGGDPVASVVVEQAVEDFLYPTYIITFNSKCGSTVTLQTVEQGGKVTEPADPNRTGYTFSGWYKESGGTTVWDFAKDTVTADMTLFAKWTINTYTVTFDKNGGDTEADPKTKTATYNGNVRTLPTEPTKTGYTFASWNTQIDDSGTGFTATTKVFANITVYAKWTINTYTVTFNSKCGSAVTSQTVEQGGKVTEPADPNRTGYTFSGWYKESGCTNPWDFATDTVTVDVTLYAKWTINTYTVTFNSKCGSTVTLQTVEQGGKVTEPADPNRTGYTFSGWYKESGCTTVWDFATDTVTVDVTLYAKWTINTYTVTFDKNGGDTEADPKTKTATYGGNIVVLPTAPTQSGYIFIGWNTQADDSGTGFTAATAVTADITVYAKWIFLDYYVSKTGNNDNYGSFDYPWETISYALGHAPDGGTIHVDDGIYTENISFTTDKVVVLQSIHGASLTTITGDGSSSVVVIDSCLAGNTLDGFTVTDGNSYNGGGIYLENSSPNIQNNIISGNTAVYGGGGIYILDSSPTVQNNTITGGESRYGGGIYLEGISSPTIQYNTISENNAGNGGGIHIYIDESASPTIQDNTISGNTAGDGGGVNISDSSSLIFQDNTISGNTASSHGGGINTRGGSPTIQDNTISGNTAGDDGGGINILQGLPTVQNNTIIGNSATDNGGGIDIYSFYIFITSPFIKDNTIIGNSATDDGGGIGIHSDFWDGSLGINTPTIQSNTISENTSVYGGGIYIENSAPTIQSNTISENTASDDGGGIYVSNGLPAMIIGGENDTDNVNFNTICGNTSLQVDPADGYPTTNYITVSCIAIGDSYDGGIVAYIFEDGDTGYVEGEMHGLIAATGDQSTGIFWHVTNDGTTGATGTALGTGNANTDKIIALYVAESNAAKLCADYTTGAYDDWFLPSKDELNKLYLNKGTIGGFVDDDHYWSSSESESNAGLAWKQYFGNGYQISFNKVDLCRVRAVRAF